MRSESIGSPGEIVDTNVFIYAHDPADADKQSRAVELLQTLTDRKVLTVTAQVLNEFYVRATRPNRLPSLSHEEAVEILADIIASAKVLPLTAAVTLRALDAVKRHRMSFWDALIWAAARENGVTVIYTEDTSGMPEIEGVRYINPFVEGDEG